MHPPTLDKAIDSHVMAFEVTLGKYAFSAL